MANSCFSLLVDNYADLTTLANLDPSSEQSSFLAENTLARRRRARVWRSNGYWQIEASKNTIVFQEDGATDLTASIAVANYSSTTSFYAAIKSALEAASVNSVTYTVSQDATSLRTVITSDGAGGATFDLIWTDVSSADMAGILGFSTASDDSGSLTYTADLLKINTEEFITFDLGLPTAIEAFAFVGDRNNPIALTPTSTIKLQASPTDEWVTPSFETTLSYVGNAIATLSDTGLDGTNQYRYWRLLIDDDTNANGFIEVSSIFLGNQFNPVNGRVQFPFSSQLVDRSRNVISEGGNTFSNSRPKTQEYAVSWFNLKKDEIEELEDLWAVYGTSIPLFVSMDGAAAWSTSFSRRVVLARFAAQPTFTLDKPNIFGATMRFVEEI